MHLLPGPSVWVYQPYSVVTNIKANFTIEEHNLTMTGIAAVLFNPALNSSTELRLLKDILQEV